MKNIFSLVALLAGMAVSSGSFAGEYMDKVKTATKNEVCAGWTYTENGQTFYVGDQDGRTIVWGNQETKEDRDNDGSAYGGAWSSKFRIQGVRKISQNCTIPVARIDFKIKEAKICNTDNGCHSYGDWAEEHAGMSHWILNFDGVCYKNISKKGVGKDDEEDDMMAAAPVGHEKTYIRVTKNNHRPCKWNKSSSEID